MLCEALGPVFQSPRLVVVPMIDFRVEGRRVVAGPADTRA